MDTKSSPAEYPPSFSNNVPMKITRERGFYFFPVNINKLEYLKPAEREMVSFWVIKPYAQREVGKNNDGASVCIDGNGASKPYCIRYGDDSNGDDSEMY